MKLKLKFFLYILFFISTAGVIAQVNTDSFLNIWENKNKLDTVRLNAMYEVSWAYLYAKPDSAYYYAKLQYAFAKKVKLKKAQSQAINVVGLSFMVRGLNDSAIFYLKLGMEIDKKLGDRQGMGAGYNNIALVYKKQGDYRHAIQYLSKSLKIQEEIGDKRGAAGSLMNIGQLYKLQEYYHEGINYIKKALVIMKVLKNEQGIASAYNNLGNIYLSLKEMRKAKKYLNLSLELLQKIGDNTGASMALNNIGKIYFIEKEYNKALNYFSKSLSIREKLNELDAIAVSLNSIGCVYKVLGDSSLLVGNNSLAHNYYSLAETNCSKSLAIGKEFKHEHVIFEASLALYEIFKKTGKINEALEMYELYISTRDSLNSEENAKTIIQLQFKYDYEKKAATDKVKQEEEKKVSAAQLKNEQTQRYALYGGLSLTILFGIFMFNRFRVTRKQKHVIEIQKQIVEKQKLLVEEKQKEVLDSIRYAKRIQEALLPSTAYIERILKKIN